MSARRRVIVFVLSIGALTEPTRSSSRWTPVFRGKCDELNRCRRPWHCSCFSSRDMSSKRDPGASKESQPTSIAAPPSGEAAPLHAASVAAASLPLCSRTTELTMLTALVLICSVAVTPDLRDCTRYNATAVMRLPAEFANPATCFIQGQAYLAGTSIGRELGDNDRVKIVCARSEMVGASIPRLTIE